MSIRNKLIISNILVFLIPIVFGYLIMTLVFNGFDKRLNRDNIFNQLRHIEFAYVNGDSEKVSSLCSAIEDGGHYIRFQSDTIHYESASYQEWESQIIDSAFRDINPDEYMVANKTGTASYYALGKGDKRVTFTILTPRPGRMPFDNQTFVNDGVGYMRNMMQLAILSILFVLILTISGLTYIISRSIIKPLTLLREGTRQIKNGNLHYTLSYPKKDEFGEVCADFDDMRRSLLALKEEEQKYEDNRKELIAGITHDLNTPLTSIKGFVSGLLENIVNTPEKRTAYLWNIKQTADKMGLLVEELLLYSTLDMNGVSFSFEKIDLAAYFKDCLLELQDEYMRNGMYLHFESECGEAFAAIDRMHFNRVVLNILGNSVKYKKNAAGNINITLSCADGQINVSFKDDGRGVPNPESGDIFKVFYRSDKSRSQSVSGSGLGLAIVQRIMAAHDGTVKTNPNYTDGLEIIISLPQA